MFRLIKIFFVFINSCWYKFYIRVRFQNVNIGNNFTVYGKLLLSINRNSNVKLGENLVFRSTTSSNFVGINKPVSIYVADSAELLIGRNCGFSGTSLYVVTKMVIGDNCNFGGNTFIWDTDFHPIDYFQRRSGIEGTKSAPVIIGNDVFVGANSIILKGVAIGDKAIIGAGSVVTKSIPEGEIWAGNPARFIRKV